MIKKSGQRGIREIVKVSKNVSKTELGPMCRMTLEHKL
jgi:hypothetical protein